MKPPGAIWVDERNPIYRRGMLACLEAEGYAIAGESAWLQPAPDLPATSVLIFDFDGAGRAQLHGLARRPELRLVGLLREASPAQARDVVPAGLAAVLPLRVLTPARLLSCIRALREGNGATPSSPIAIAPTPADDRQDSGLTQREFDVLCLLADGSSTRDIATRLSYSERTVKNIVRDLLMKLNGRTRAHAVALAARRGVI
jgi:DNA-binding NarL/FixJ family response regulator